MAALKTATKFKMLPYRLQDEIDYASLDFNPDVPETPPDAMEQNREVREILNHLSARFTDFDRRPDVFLDSDTNICYDPRNLNIRIAPDVYLAFGVDAEAIRPRKLYLPWEVGKPPDLALEVASESTSRQDVNRKPGVYAQIGVPEYWRFDLTGGRYHGRPLSGERLADSVYQPIELTNEPDGILKGYSEVLELSLCWDGGWPRFYDPKTGTYLESPQQIWESRETERKARAAAESALQAEREGRMADQNRIRQLEAELRPPATLKLGRKLDSGDSTSRRSKLADAPARFDVVAQTRGCYHGQSEGTTGYWAILGGRGARVCSGALVRTPRV